MQACRLLAQTPRYQILGAVTPGPWTRCILDSPYVPCSRTQTKRRDESWQTCCADAAFPTLGAVPRVATSQRQGCQIKSNIFLPSWLLFITRLINIPQPEISFIACLDFYWVSFLFYVCCTRRNIAWSALGKPQKGKGLATKKGNFLKLFFLFYSQSKMKHISFKGFFYWWGVIFLAKSVFGYFKTYIQMAKRSLLMGNNLNN